MAVLFAAHYIPWTQFALKYVATALGAVSLIEFAGRSFTSNTLSARLRPEGGYKKIPELTLNATLHDVHDLLQSAVVEVQKIIYGEDLAKTFTVSPRLPWVLCSSTPSSALTIHRHSSP